MRSAVPIASCIILATFLLGCSSGAGKAPVSGKITWKGKPVAQGSITFQGERGAAVQGEIVDGQYRLGGDRAVPVGTVKVMIDVMEEQPGEILIGPGKKSKEVKQVAPAKYNTATKLKFDVEGGKENTFNVDLMP